MGTKFGLRERALETEASGASAGTEQDLSALVEALRVDRVRQQAEIDEMREKLEEACAVLGTILSLGVLNGVEHGITKPRAEALFDRLSEDAGERA